MANVVFFLKKICSDQIHVYHIDGLAGKNEVLTSTPLSLQTANKNNVLNKCFTKCQFMFRYLMPLIQYLKITV